MEEQIIRQQNNNTDTSPPTKIVTTVVKNNIKGFIHWGIIISSALMSITFIISWILWLTLFRNNINEIITVVNIVITNKGIKFNLTFQTLTIAVLAFSIVTLGVTTFPFIFLKKKSTITLILGIVMLVISALLIVGSALFGAFGYCAFRDYVVSKSSIADILFFAIPAGLEMVYCLILVIFCVLLILTGFKNKKKIVELAFPVINKTKENDTSVTQGMSPFSKTSSEPIAFVEPKTEVQTTDVFQDVRSQTSANNPAGQQGINIIINNNAVSPQNQLSPQPIVATVIPSVSTNNPVFSQPSPQPLLTADKMRWSKQQIEYVWSKGEIISNFNPSLYRKDYAGALMYKNSFLDNVRLNDDVKSLNWTIVHQKPFLAGGSDDISNLVPLNNTNAVSKGNNYPRWKTTVTHSGQENVFKEKSWKDNK